MQYVAIINTPGYLPWADEIPTFDTAREAWEFLADERKVQEDDTDDESEGYSATVNTLEMASSGCIADYANAGLDEMTGTGTVYGGTPGNDSEHDLGLAYSVDFAEEEI